MPPRHGGSDGTCPQAAITPAGEGQAAATAAGSEAAIDLAHLRRATFGEDSLAREVLRLFDRQADILLAQIKRASPGSAASLAHTLKGSARGIGAWKVAATAEQYELAEQGSDAESLAHSFEQLGHAVTETRYAIRTLLAVRGELSSAASMG
jgi:HPt (histidine-containing phosphotransfer) domain-containing protein